MSDIVEHTGLSAAVTVLENIGATHEAGKCREVAAEITRLRSLVEEAGKVVAILSEGDERRIAEALCEAVGWEVNGLISVDGGPLLKGWQHFTEAARSLLDKMKEG